MDVQSLKDLSWYVGSTDPLCCLLIVRIVFSGIIAGKVA
jgi:hypothetical protein